jgi:hypothetical protein
MAQRTYLDPEVDLVAFNQCDLKRNVLVYKNGLTLTRGKYSFLLFAGLVHFTKSQKETPLRDDQN